MSSRHISMGQANAAMHDVFIKMLPQELTPKDHAMLNMDRAVWHGAGTREIPRSTTIFYGDRRQCLCTRPAER